MTLQSGTTEQTPPDRWLAGYLHSTFTNSAGHLDLAAVPATWNLIMLSFGETTSPESGDVRFEPTEVNQDALAHAVALSRTRGQRVLLSIGGESEVRLTTTDARNAFVRSVSDIVDRYGLDGIDVNVEGWSLWLDPGDDDFRRPTTPVVVNLIWALKRLKERYGPQWVLTMAPETFFVQAGFQCYGTQADDARAGVYLPLLEAMRHDLTLVHVQNYNSGPVRGLDGRQHHVGDAKFHVAMTDMLLTGFPVGQDDSKHFAALRPNQVALGFLSAPVDDGYLPPSEVRTAVFSILGGADCEGYELRSGASPALGGLMAWSINWDRRFGWLFMQNYDDFLSTPAPNLSDTRPGEGQREIAQSPPPSEMTFIGRSE